MKRWIAVVLMVLVGVARAQTAPATRPTTMRTDLDPTVAAEKQGRDGKPDAGFVVRHTRYVERAKKGDVGLLFLGDSITQGWEGQKQIWEDSFGKSKPPNFGIGGDRTQHVLWRIENGELEGIKPKVAVIMIGTNNAGGDPADKIAEGVEKIVKETREKTGAKILLFAIFPRGQDPKNGPKAQDTAMLRAKIAQVNERISKMDDGKDIKYMDIGDKFLEPDGTIKPTIMRDYLHLTKEGYQRWADAIKPALEEMMK